MGLLVYIERDGVPVLETDPLAWAMWMARDREPVALTHCGLEVVSTFFMGFELPGGRFYETAHFDAAGKCSVVGRYVTRSQAEKGHGQTVAEVHAAQDGPDTPGGFG